MKALRKKIDVPQRGKNSASGLPFDLRQKHQLFQISSLPANPANVAFFSPRSHMSKFLKIKPLSLHIYTLMHTYMHAYCTYIYVHIQHMCTYMYMCIHTHTHLGYKPYWFCFPGKHLHTLPPLLTPLTAQTEAAWLQLPFS